MYYLVLQVCYYLMVGQVRPLHMYRNSLVHGEAELGGVTGGGQAKRQYNKKRRRSAEEGEEEDPDDPDFR